MKAIPVKFFTRKGCQLCDEALEALEIVQVDFPLKIEIIDIYKDDLLLEKYQLMIPVIEIDEIVVDYGTISIFNILEFLKERDI